MTETPSLRERQALLREVRERTGISLRKLGKLAKISYSMLSLFETGERDLSAEAWNRVMGAMEKFRIGANKERTAEIARLKNEQAELQKKAAKLGVSGLLRAQTEPELDDILSSMPAGEAEAAIPLLESLSAKLDGKSVAWRIVRVALGELRLKVKEYKTERLRNLYALQENFRKESEERKRQLEALERLPGALDDPIVVGLIESLRRELEEKSRELEAVMPLASPAPQEQK